MARPRKRSTPTPPAPEAAAAGNGAEQLLGPVALASPDPVTTDWIPMWGPTPNTLPQDTVIAAATRIIANRLATADANAAWQVRGDGRMDWGAGGAGAYDANLYRSAAGTLKTDGYLKSGTDYIAAGTQGGLVLSCTLGAGAPGNGDFIGGNPPIGTLMCAKDNNRLWCRFADGVWRSVALA